MDTNMKKLLLILALFLFPTFAHAQITPTWGATSTTQGDIFPDTINGVMQRVTAKNFLASSTSATSTFMGHGIFGQTATASFGDVYAFGLSGSSALFQSGSTVCAALYNGVIGYHCGNSAGNFTANFFDLGENEGLNIVNGLNTFTAGTSLYSFIGNGNALILGNLGVSSTTPGIKLSVSGSGYFDGNVKTSFFVATSTTASVFPNASTTVLTVSGNTYLSPSGSALNRFGVGTTSPGAFVSFAAPASGGFPTLLVQIADDVRNGVTITESVNNRLVMNINGNNDEVIFNPTSGKFGLGTSTPASTLSVEGSSSLGNFATAGYFNATSTTGTSTIINVLRIGDYSLGSLNNDNTPLRIRNGAIDNQWWADFETGFGDNEIKIGKTPGTPNSEIQVLNDNSPAGLVLNSAGGNVGIGTTSPQAIFSIGTAGSGVMISNTATSSFTKGINLSGGCFAISGVCIGGGAGGGSGTVNTGVAGQIAWYASSGTAVSGTSTTLTVGSLIATTTATSTFVGGIQTKALNVTQTTASSTFANGIIFSGGSLTLSTMPNCTGSFGLATDSSGNLTCDADAGAGAGVTGTGQLGMMTAWSGTGSIISTSTIVGDQLIATGTRASVLPYASTTAVTAVTASTTNLIVSSIISSLIRTDSTGKLAATTLTSADFPNPIVGGFSFNGGGNLIDSTNSLGTPGMILMTTGSTPRWVATTTFSSGLTYSAGNVILNMANPNIWTALQTFTSASSTSLSALDAVQVGRTSTTTIRGDLATSTFSFALSTQSASTTATSTMAGINLPYGGCFAIAGVCLSTSGGGGTANAKWATSTALSTGIYTNGATTVGIGSSTPWSTLAIVSNSSAPQFVISTSTTGTVPPLVWVTATTTGVQNWQRFLVGTSTGRDQLTVDGRIYSSMKEMRCDFPGASLTAAVTTGSANLCGQFTFNLDTTGFMESPSVIATEGGNANNPSVLRIGAGASGVAGLAAANVGSAVRSIAPFFSASSSPVMEVSVMQGTSTQASFWPVASSTLYTIGWDNQNTVSPVLEIIPNSFIGFVSTSTNNWISVVRSNGTYTHWGDTGFATTTSPLLSYSKMRIEMNENEILFIINTNVVNRVTTSIPTQNFGYTISVASTAAGLKKTFNISGIRLWTE
jgi:hypothetical protein